jgi:hypothetical protein
MFPVLWNNENLRRRITNSGGISEELYKEVCYYFVSKPSIYLKFQNQLGNTRTAYNCADPPFFNYLESCKTCVQGCICSQICV